MRKRAKCREWKVEEQDRVADLADRLRVLAWAIRGLAADKPGVSPEERAQYAMAAELEGVAREMEAMGR